MCSPPLWYLIIVYCIVLNNEIKRNDRYYKKPFFAGNCNEGRLRFIFHCTWNLLDFLWTFCPGISSNLDNANPWYLLCSLETMLSQHLWKFQLLKFSLPGIRCGIFRRKHWREWLWITLSCNGYVIDASSNRKRRKPRKYQSVATFFVIKLTLIGQIWWIFFLRYPWLFFINS